MAIQRFAPPDRIFYLLQQDVTLFLADLAKRAIFADIPLISQLPLVPELPLMKFEGLDLRQHVGLFKRDDLRFRLFPLAKQSFT